MRTTLNLDGDVLDGAKSLAKKLGKPFRHVVNEAMRSGLQSIGQAGAAKPYRMPARDMGLKPGVNLDNIGELLELMEESETQR